MQNQAQSISILYIGDGRDHCVLPTLEKHDGHKWDLYAARDLFDALATYILYQPHVTVFAGRSDLTENAFLHITSLDAPPLRLVDAILVFGEDTPGDVPATTLLRHRPFPNYEDEVISAVMQLACQRAEAEVEAARNLRAQAEVF